MPVASLVCSVAYAYLLKNLLPFQIGPLCQPIPPLDPLLRHGCCGQGLDVLWNQAHGGVAGGQGCHETAGAVQSCPSAHGRSSVRLAGTEIPCLNTCGHKKRPVHPGGLVWTCGTKKAHWEHDPPKTNPAGLEDIQDGFLRYLEKQETDKECQ